MRSLMPPSIPYNHAGGGAGWECLPFCHRKLDLLKYSKYHLIMKTTPSSSVAFQQQIALIGHAVGSPPRLRLLTLLAQGTKTVEELAAELGESLANTSAHLKVLRGACLVERQKDGRFARYTLASPSVEHFLLVLRELAEERLPELREVIRQFNEDRGALIDLPPDELLAGVRAGRLTLVDVRPASEFTAGHLPGATCMPLESLRKRTPKLRGPIIVYCRGPYCVGAQEAVTLLRRAGVDAKRILVGVSEWRTAGHPVASGESQNIKGSRS